jgi:hypothetical protein
MYLDLDGPFCPSPPLNRSVRIRPPGLAGRAWPRPGLCWPLHAYAAWLLLAVAGLCWPGRLLAMAEHALGCPTVHTHYIHNKWERDDANNG